MYCISVYCIILRYSDSEFEFNKLKFLTSNFIYWYKKTYTRRVSSKSTFTFPKIRTSFGKLNIRFFGPKILERE